MKAIGLMAKVMGKESADCNVSIMLVNHYYY